MQGIADITSTILTAGDRHTRSRIGGREPIHPVVRKLVYARDGYRCRWCGSSERLTLDHVVPWSAGGSDRSDNLRTLCWECNEDRSNFRTDSDVARPVGVTDLCLPCWLPHLYADEVPADDCPHIPVYCGQCSAVSWTHHEVWVR